MQHKSIDAKIKKIIEEEAVTVEPDIIDEYKELNEKCDTVISKIKKRKNLKKEAASNAG